MSRTVKENLGTVIKEAIKEKGLNQSAVAAKMGFKRQTINQLDRRKTFDLEFLQLLKEATGLDFTDYNFKNEPLATKFKEQLIQYSEDKNEGQQVEMILSVKVKSEPDEISKIGDLILIIRREAKKMGFTIL